MLWYGLQMRIVRKCGLIGNRESWLVYEGRVDHRAYRWASMSRPDRDPDLATAKRLDPLPPTHLPTAYNLLSIAEYWQRAALLVGHARGLRQYFGLLVKVDRFHLVPLVFTSIQKTSDQGVLSPGFP